MNKKSTIILLFAMTLLIGMATGYSLRGVLPPPAESGQDTSRLEQRGIGQNEAMRERQRGNGRERMREHLTERLELQPNQIDAVMTVLTEHRREMAQISEASREQLRIHIREQTDELNSDLRALLSVEQFQRWESMHREREQRYRQRRGN